MFHTLLKRISPQSLLKRCFRYTNSSAPLLANNKADEKPCTPKEEKESGVQKICDTKLIKKIPPCDISQCPHVKKEIEDKNNSKEKDKEKKKVGIPDKKGSPLKKKDEEEVEELLSTEPLVTADYNDSKVVIIGGGAAGIAAAQFLEDNNITNYIILEALGRLGGRIQTEWFGDTVVELGARSPKGSSEFSPFLQMAMADGILTGPITHTSIFSTSEGRSINQSTSLIAYEIFKSIYSESLDVEADQLDYINFRMEQELANFPHHVKQDAARVMLGLSAMMYRREGDNLKFISREGSGTFLQSPGGTVRVPLGYYGVLQPLINKIPPEKIKLNKPVQNIRWGAVVCKDTPRALVKCSDGSVYPADYVIITVSLGVLKANGDSLFCPALPADKVKAMNKLGYRHINHIYFRFNEPFWSWTTKSIDLKFKEEDQLEQEDWTRGIIRIKQMPGSNNVLWVKIGGEEAQSFEKLDPSRAVDDVMKIIKDKMQILCVPSAIESLHSAWSNNVYFHGAYSYLPTGICDDTVCELSTPLPGNNAPVSPILFFAGEATCPKLHSTVQGAKISGIREASRIKRIITSGIDIKNSKEQRMAMTG